MPFVCIAVLAIVLVVAYVIIFTYLTRYYISGHGLMNDLFDNHPIRIHVLEDFRVIIKVLLLFLVVTTIVQLVM